MFLYFQTPLPFGWSFGIDFRKCVKYSFFLFLIGLDVFRTSTGRGKLTFLGWVSELTIGNVLTSPFLYFLQFSTFRNVSKLSFWVRLRINSKKRITFLFINLQVLVFLTLLGYGMLFLWGSVFFLQKFFTSYSRKRLLTFLYILFFYRFRLMAPWNDILKLFKECLLY